MDMALQEKARRLAKIYSDIASGNTWQYKYKGQTVWHNITLDSVGLHLSSDLAQFRRKPKELTEVDLTPLIDSGIDCEFWDKESDYKYIALLSNISASATHPYHTKRPTLGSFKFCRPRYKVWYPWHGGTRPIPKGLMIDIITRDGEYALGMRSGVVRWDHSELAAKDIISFRVNGLAANYYYIWEDTQ